jgi:ketoreductase
VTQIVSETKTAVVVGASRGIGYSCAMALGKAGADVVVAARTSTDLKSLAVQLEKMGRRSLAVKVDVRKKKDVEDLVERTVGTFDRIDILVYASGVATLEKTLAESRDEIFEETMAVNVRGLYWTMREVLTAGKMLERKNGRIIAIGSDWGKTGAAGVAAYVASKHAALGLVRSVALEVGKAGITVNAVCPGFVSTKMAWDMAPQFAELCGVAPDKADDFLKSFDPLYRISTPDEIAEMVVFLAMTNGGKAATGQAFNIASNVMS